jgi:hypothetical protein
MESKLSFKEIKFEEVLDQTLVAKFTKTCSGSRSDCCTRTCRPYEEEQDWGQYMDVYGGAVQY